MRKPPPSSSTAITTTTGFRAKADVVSSRNDWAYYKSGLDCVSVPLLLFPCVRRRTIVLWCRAIAVAVEF